MADWQFLDRNCHWCQRRKNERPNDLFNYFCDPDNRKYLLTIPPKSVTFGINDAKWTCSPKVGGRSNEVEFSVTGLLICIGYHLSSLRVRQYPPRLLRQIDHSR